MAVDPPLWVACVERFRLARLEADTYLGLAGAQGEQRHGPCKVAQGVCKRRIRGPLGVLGKFAVVLRE